jgi:hypothetical protein
VTRPCRLAPRAGQNSGPNMGHAFDVAHCVDDAVARPSERVCADHATTMAS